MSFVSDFIPDDYEIDGYIAPVERLHGELRFRYRPMLGLDVQDLLERTKGKKETEIHKAVLREAAKRLKSWSLLGPTGQPVPLSADNFERLRPVLQDKVVAVVQGYRPNDEDSTEKTTPETSEQILEAREKN